jgi:uncharacterized protein YyaL (SSP411 family)
VDLWQPYIAGYEHPLAAAQSYARAAKMTGNPTMVKAARRWARLIESNFPAKSVLDNTWYKGYAKKWAPHGTYAEHYGRAILFFLDLHAATEQEDHLAMTKRVANHAIAKLWYDGLFRGHPKKPLYEAVDGVGLLMEALAKLEQAT